MWWGFQEEEAERERERFRRQREEREKIKNYKQENNHDDVRLDAKS